MSELERILFIVIAFILGGTGLGILYNGEGLSSIIGGFALIGIAIAAISKVLN